mmetsp:Transcript_53806/g.65953  ORF Transcript_53806/g.65953 Transcript_53806/m.65953 type:complete len:118 (+) Transcript_53806:62-415(+)
MPSCNQVSCADADIMCPIDSSWFGCACCGWSAKDTGSNIDTGSQHLLGFIKSMMNDNDNREILYYGNEMMMIGIIIGIVITFVIGLMVYCFCAKKGNNKGSIKYNRITDESSKNDLI